MFYDVLKPLCHQRGITPFKMAKDLGISPRTQANWKRGSEPREETKIRIAEYLGVDPSYFDEPVTEISVESDAVKQFIEEQSKVDENEQLLLQAYRVLDDAGKNDLLLYALKLKFKAQ